MVYTLVTIGLLGLIVVNLLALLALVMAYLYRKKRSPFWYVVFTNSEGKELHRSTGFRADDPNDTARARALRAELESKELHREPGPVGESWDTWVIHFLERHCKTKKTYDRYLDAWKWLALWMQQEHIQAPRQVTYKRGVEYLDWRTTYKKRTGKTVGRNTAIFELKMLSLIMGEAVRMGYADANPLANLKLHKDKPAKKPEITDEELAKIQHALKEEPEWMQISFTIALHTGCRLGETKIPLDCVDLKEEKITFPSPKGGEDRAFSIPMPTALKPIFEKMKSERRKYTLDFPFQPSRRWQQFFIKISMPHLCFHCLRITFVNRIRRAGVPREVAMRLVNHASELVHKIYQREKVEDIAQWRDIVRFTCTEN